MRPRVPVQHMEPPLRRVERPPRTVKRTLAGLDRRVSRRFGRERVRAHLARAEARLRARDPPAGVDPDRRAAHLDALESYWRRGAFPTNREYPERTPLFRGPGGVPCAMGAVVAADGRPDVVEAVVREDDAVNLETDAPPAALAEWLDGAGLSAEEAAFVQPTYDPACLGPLSCSQLRMFLATVWLIAACWLEYGLYRVLGARVESARRRAVAFLAGIAVGLLTLATVVFAVYTALYSPGWAV